MYESSSSGQAERVGRELNIARDISLRYPALSTIACVLLINALVTAYLWLCGRPFVPPAIPLRLWSGDLGAGDNSLHLSDPYSLLHAVFGIGLFLFIDWMKPLWPLREKLIVAVAGSAFWELVENTPFVIALFNEASGPDAYRGDSIVNSLSDTAFVMVGFVMASRMPPRLCVALAILVDALVTLWINDGLALGLWRIVKP